MSEYALWFIFPVITRLRSLVYYNSSGADTPSLFMACAG